MRCSGSSEDVFIVCYDSNRNERAVLTCCKLTQHTLHCDLLLAPMFVLRCGQMDCRAGAAIFKQLLTDDIALPPASQMPDTIVYLCKGSSARDCKRICFCRIPTVEIVSTGYSGLPKWYQLAEDKAINALATDVFPGSLLLRLGAVQVGALVAPADVLSWEADLARADTLTPYELRVSRNICFES